MARIIGKVFKYGLGFSVIGAGVGSVFLHQTKPSDESFNNFITKDGEPIDKMVIDIALATIIKPTFKDWVIFKTATISDKKQDIVYIGAVNNWTHWYETNKS